MKINLISDLHLEFGKLNLPGGDILILAGDVCEVAYLDEHMPFFEEQCAKYNQVLYVLGNHEHYHGNILDSKEVLENNLPANIKVLENDVFTIDDVTFLGATMWTDFNNGNPMAMWEAKRCMNDFRLIKAYSTDMYRKNILTPDIVYDIHKQSFRFLEENVPKYDKIVIVTHHAPTYGSIDLKKFGDSVLNSAYASEYAEFILDNPNIHTWVHGHTHKFNDYMVGTTRVISNPRGYIGYEESASNFDTKFSFEV